MKTLYRSHFTKLVLSLLQLAILWQGAASILQNPTFPGVFPVISQLRQPDLLVTLAGHLWSSLLKLMVGMGSGGLIGAVVGFVFGWYPSLRRSFFGLFELIYPFPKVVLVPILILIFGIGDLSKITLIGVVVFFQMVVTFKDAIIYFPPSYLDAARVHGAYQIPLIRSILLPLILHRVFSGIKISLGTAMAVLFFAETYATNEGIGYFIWDAFSRFDFEQIYFASLCYCLLGYFLYQILQVLEDSCVNPNG